jgi:long-chain acyl-CoA synthetase
MENNEKDNSTTHELLDKIFFNKSKMALGGKVRMAATGGAPISGDVLKFLKCTLCTPILEGYGQTESTGMTFGTNVEDPTTAIVGGVSRQMEFKLIDIPEMSYTSKDVVNGKLTPRGEICFRGVSVFPGYYKDMEKTNETVDSDGWLHSGDVGQLFPNGSLKIIDRKKNLFKLA